MGIDLKKVAKEEKKRLLAIRKANKAKRKQAIEAARQKVTEKGKVLAEHAKTERTKQKLAAKRQAFIDKLKKDEETRSIRRAAYEEKALKRKQEKEKQAIANIRRKLKLPDSTEVTINPKTGGFLIKEKMKAEEVTKTEI